MNDKELLKAIEKIIANGIETALVPVKKDIKKLNGRINEVHKELNDRINEVHKEVNARIDYYHKPTEPTSTELMPLKSVISLTILQEPTLKWAERIYPQIVKQFPSKKYKGLWINSPKKWYDKANKFLKQIDTKNILAVAVWNEIKEGE